VKILALPRGAAPYQRDLYAELERLGARVRYLQVATPSRTLNNLLLPLQLAAGRLRGWRLLHIHWVYDFVAPGSARRPWLRRVAQWWFTLVLAVARALGVRIVWTAHNVLPHDPIFADDAAARRSLVRAADLVIAHSPATLEELDRLGARPRRSVILPHGAFEPATAHGALRAPRSGDGEVHAVYFGKVAAYKGVEDLLDAAAGLPRESGVRITVAGECPDPILRDRLERSARRAEARVDLRLGRVPDEDVTPLLEDADVVVLPFRRITTSASALLAMAHERPVVLPDVPAFAELPPGAVIRYDRTTEDLARVLRQLPARPPEELRRIGRAAAEHTAQHRWPAVARRTLAAFEEVLEER
jgi:glycosyltransferase involved in cell wall biosynthesis